MTSEVLEVDTNSNVELLKNDSVNNASLLSPNRDASVVPRPTDDSSHSTHVTIQLPDGMQGATLSQQKLQELILQLSQSGQIQLREDSKIVIDLKFSGKSNDVVASKADQRASPLTSMSNPSPRSPVKSSVETPGSSVNQAKPTVVQVKPEPISVITRPHPQPQPTYILLPAGQLSGFGEGQLYSGSGALRTVSAGGTLLRTVTGTTVSSVNTLGSQDRSFIVLQQPISASGLTTSPAVVNNTSSATLVPLRQLTGTGVGRASNSTTWVNASSNRFTGSGSTGELYVTNAAGSVTVGPRTNQNSYLTISSNVANAGGNSSRESSWQQYVKQFTKLGPCPICGDKISGYHYGIFCCESCKGFFKRTVQNAKRYACHHPSASSVCEINVASRKKCPACRFIKCVEKGMRIEAIRSDRTRGGRSMYPGSRYLRQIAARVSGGRPGAGGDSSTDPDNVNIILSGRDGSDDSEQLSCSIMGLTGVHHTLGPDGLPASMDAGGGVYLDPAILGTQGDDEEEDEGADHRSIQVEQSMLDYSNPLNPSSCNTPYLGRQVIVTARGENVNRTRIELPKIISDIIAVEESMEAEPEDALEIETSNSPDATVPDGVSEDEAAVYRALLNLADQRLYRTVRWSRALPDFAQLDTDDQILLLQNCWADLLCLDCCWRSLPTPTEIRLTSSKCINLEAARELGAEEIVERMLQLTQYLTQLELDVVEYACLKVIVLMQPDLKNLKADGHVRHYQSAVQRLLMEYIAKSSPTKRDKYSRLMSRIPELQTTSQTARLMLVDLDLSSYLSNNSLLMELLRSDIQRFAPSGSSVNTGIVDDVTVDACDDDLKHSVVETTVSISDGGSIVSDSVAPNDNSVMVAFTAASMGASDAMGTSSDQVVYVDGDMAVEASGSVVLTSKT